MFFKELATGLGFSLECKICDKRLDNPRQVWTCGHVFCQKCLKKAASNGNKGRLDSFASLIKAAEKKKAELHEILTDYNDNGKISRLEFEIALRRVKIMLNEEQKELLCDLIDGYLSPGALLAANAADKKKVRKFGRPGKKCGVNMSTEYLRAS